MGILDRYAEIEMKIPDINTKRIETPKELEPIILSNDAKCITLAEFSPECKDIIRVHSLANYRRKSSLLILVPNLNASIDCLLFDRKELLECSLTL